MPADGLRAFGDLFLIADVSRYTHPTIRSMNVGWVQRETPLNKNLDIQRA